MLAGAGTAARRAVGPQAGWRALGGPVAGAVFGAAWSCVGLSVRWPAGTHRSRLARAREKPRHGLTRRGVTLPATTLGAVLAPRSARASVSSLLCDSTTKAATAFPARHAAAGGALSASAAALA